MKKFQRALVVAYERWKKIPFEFQVGIGLIVLAFIGNNLRSLSGEPGQRDGASTAQVNESEARQLCFDHFDFNRGRWLSGTVQAWPWE